jgi:integrase
VGRVFKRGKKWYVDYREPDGKRHKIAIGTRKQEALEALDRIRAEMFLNHPPRRGEDRTFGEVAVEWLYRHCRVQCSHSTFIRNRSAINNQIIPLLGRIKISRFKRKHVRDFTATLTETLKRSTVNRVLAVVSKILSDAHEWEYIDREIKVKFLRVAEQPYDFLTKREVNRLLAVCEGEMYLFVALSVYTGMRKYETINLEGRHINLDRGIITVVKSKSGRIRHIPINDNLYPLLKDLPEERIFQYKWSGSYDKGFRRALRKAKLRHIRIHDLRHTFASHYIMSGGSEASLQEILGHQNPIHTRRYRHLTPEFMKHEINLISFGPKLGTIKKTRGRK